MRTVLPLALSCVLLGVGCSKSDLGHVDGARLLPREDGTATLVVEGWPDITLSHDEIGGRTNVEIAYVRSSHVVSWKAMDSRWENGVWLGANVVRAPKTDTPSDFPTAAGALLLTEKDQNVVMVESRARGKAVLAGVLVKAGETEGPTWEKRVETLAADERAELTKAFESVLLDPKSAPASLPRAVTFVDVEKLPADKLLARVTPIVTDKEPVGALGASLVLRVLAAKGAGAGKLACQGLSSRPWKLEEPDPNKKLMLDAMLMAIAKEGLDCAAVDAIVKEDPCASLLRCGEKGPVLPNETSDQAEPLCAEAALKKSVDTELARPRAEVLLDPHPGRTSGWAYAAFVLGKRPALADVDKRHMRRLYAIVQPKGPACETIAEAGKPCHAEPHLLRDLVCRNDGETIAVGTIKLRVSDEKKTLSDVQTSPPP